MSPRQHISPPALNAKLFIDGLAVSLGLRPFLRNLLCTVVLFVHIAPAHSKDSPWLPDLVTIASGAFVSGSNREERDLGYRLDEIAYGHSITRKQRWYESEHERQVRTLPQYSITRKPITRCDYARFVEDTGHPTPQIDEASWDAQGLIHAYDSTLKFQWKPGEQDKQGRCQHPVVLVTHEDAKAYAAWLSKKSGRNWRLPNEFEWEKAARGTEGNLFPWGNQFDESKLNSHDSGPFDTLPVGTFETGASPFGVLDVAGQVFEWTATKNDNNPQRFTVKGGSWDDKGCGVCRTAARHFRHESLKHILVGFRLVTD